MKDIAREFFYCLCNCWSFIGRIELSFMVGEHLIKLRTCMNEEDKPTYPISSLNSFVCPHNAPHSEPFTGVPSTINSPICILWTQANLCLTCCCSRGQKSLSFLIGSAMGRMGVACRLHSSGMRGIVAELAANCRGYKCKNRVGLIRNKRTLRSHAVIGTNSV